MKFQLQTKYLVRVMRWEEYCAVQTVPPEQVDGFVAFSLEKNIAKLLFWSLATHQSVKGSTLGPPALP